MKSAKEKGCLGAPNDSFPYSPQSMNTYALKMDWTAGARGEVLNRFT